jgi:hypothetical protein
LPFSEIVLVQLGFEALHFFAFDEGVVTLLCTDAQLSPGFAWSVAWHRPVQLDTT